MPDATCERWIKPAKSTTIASHVYLDAAYRGLWFRESERSQSTKRRAPPPQRLHKTRRVQACSQERSKRPSKAASHLHDGVIHV